MEESTRGVSVFYCCDNTDNNTQSIQSKMEHLIIDPECKSLHYIPTTVIENSSSFVSSNIADDGSSASPSVTVSQVPVPQPSVHFQQHSETETHRLCGMLTKTSTVGFVKTNKPYWFVFGDETCKLYYYRNPNDILPQGEIDISNASFSYDVNKDKLQSGVLQISSEGKTHYLDAQDRPKMLYWLQELQNKRRQYSKNRTSLSSERLQLTIQKRNQSSGLLGFKDEDTTDIKDAQCSDAAIPSLTIDTTLFDSQLPSKPTSFPSSFKTEFRNIISSIKTQIQSPTDKYSPQPSPHSVSSNEEWSIVEPDPFDNTQSTAEITKAKFLSTIKKIRIGKRTSSEGNIKLPPLSSCVRCKHLLEENVSLKEDLKSTEDELQAHREIVKLLQKELETRMVILNTSEDSENKDKEGLLQMLRERDKHIVELQHGLSLVQEEKSLLVQQTRQLESEETSIKEHSVMLQEMMLAKTEIIEKLTSQIYDLENGNKNEYAINSLSDQMSSSLELDSALPQSKVNVYLPTTKEVENLKDACTAYEIQNKFLTNEILELKELRQHDVDREKMLLMNTAKIEGDFLQTRSKYLYLLKELETPKLGGEEEEVKRQDVINQLLQEAMECEKTQHETDRRHLFLSSYSTQEYDKYGFQKWATDESEDVILARAGQLQQQSDILTSRVKEAEEATSHQVKWENFMVGQSGKYLTRSHELKTLIRSGIPHEYREQIWKGCINLHVVETKSKLGVTYYKDLVRRARTTKYNPAAKQIELDLLRTLPTNIHFECIDSTGVRKLRQVLLAYSIHNPVIGYCQGLNRLVAIALLFLTEEESFWCLVAIVDHIMPVDYYTKTLAAAQADQRVLKDLVQEKLPKLYSHFETYEADLSLFTFNWFLTVFVDNVPTETFLKVWDSLLYEGSKVMFRFAIAFLKLVEDEILLQTSSLAINRFMRTVGEKLVNSKRIAQIAFHDLNPFPMKIVSTRRQYHLQQIRCELAELDMLRQKFSSQDIPSDRKDYYSDDDLDM